MLSEVINRTMEIVLLTEIKIAILSYIFLNREDGSGDVQLLPLSYQNAAIKHADDTKR
jgi:hypothetical protein